MDDSRSVLQSNLRLLRSGEAPLPPSTFEFSCHVCGGRECTVEIRQGTDVTLTRLLIFEQAGFGDEPGTHKVYRCVRCAGAVEASRASARDALVGSLLFAAKNLVERQFTRIKSAGRSVVICSECRIEQVDDRRLLHSAPCYAGRVMRLLNALTSLDDLPFESLVDGVAGVCSPVLACVGAAENPLPLAAVSADNCSSAMGVSLEQQIGGAR